MLTSALNSNHSLMASGIGARKSALDLPKDDVYNSRLVSLAGFFLFLEALSYLGFASCTMPKSDVQYLPSLTDSRIDVLFLSLFPPYSLMFFFLLKGLTANRLPLDSEVRNLYSQLLKSTTLT